MMSATTTTAGFLSPDLFPVPSANWWMHPGSFPGAPDSAIGGALNAYFRTLRQLEGHDNDNAQWWTEFWSRHDMVFTRSEKRRELTAAVTVDQEFAFDRAEAWLTRVQPEADRLDERRGELTGRVSDAMTVLAMLVWGPGGAHRHERPYGLPGPGPVLLTDWPDLGEHMSLQQTLDRLRWGWPEVQTHRFGTHPLDARYIAWQNRALTLVGRPTG